MQGFKNKWVEAKEWQTNLLKRIKSKTL